MKKLFALLLTLLLVIGLFAGCTTTDTDTTDTTDSDAVMDDETDDSAGDDTADVPMKDQEVVIYQNKVEIHEQLSAFAAEYEAATGVKVTVKTSGGDSPYAENLKAEFQSDRQPDIFVIEGMGGYNTWASKLTPFENEEWMDLTALEFVVDGTTYGFPVAVEGWGMAYNVDMLKKAGVDPASLTSQEAYEAAFEKIDSMKDELGIKSVVAMAAGPDMRWVTGLHNFNGYLSAGLEFGDTTVLDKLNMGEADMQRLTEYADWVELLFNYSDRAVLLTGNYDAQVGQFGTQQSAFIHQGNWIDPWMISNGVDFPMAFAPHASVKGELTTIFIGAPSFYVLNNESENMDAAKAFLNYMATNEAGHNYMVKEAQMVPAFTNVTLKPDAPLSANLAEWVAKGKAYTWLQNDMPDGFGMGTIAPIYESFAKGDITKEEFINLIKDKIEELK
ncbi:MULTISPECIES: ABC transporter substrate-binding protein [unclassified Fusibacter]|uniref:ABC transporter substrate-binding protein n=1 Tax=unclassified Fusibacter TaxID=2624464 RepID=UPI001011B244|nr:MULTISPECIES: ABC transporter substrate-binding protein [unclassified Fusibacter]MCK8060468.1 ABC transporter substrate-binding protein [Fusibacter sp. A2]NPE20243.1 carbohydrate ABC transporter substrate-binding protein [Fusibacter sp. A1]RXV63450.1 carbohydrate ABC transporter substrate-binding protein [Fusibacter sp. A1]